MAANRLTTVNIVPPLFDLYAVEAWRAEFRGLFIGEGWMGITRFKQRRNGNAYWNYRPEMMLCQNFENEEMVRHIRDVLGGFVYKRAAYRHGSDKQVRGPYFTWQARSQIVCDRALRCLESGLIPDKKEPKIRALREYLDILSEYKGSAKPQEVLDRIQVLRTSVTPNGHPEREL